MFYLASAFLTCYVVWTYATRGPRAAVAASWGYALLIPTWIGSTLGPTTFNLRSAGALLALGVVLAASGRLLPGGWMLTDVVVTGLVLSQLTTEYASDNLSVTMALSLVTDWILPYALGRVVLASVGDLKRLTSIAAWVCLGLAGLAVTESVTRINPLNAALGHPGSMQGESDIRWGLKRAEGNATHPIFFGMGLVMMLPWAVEAASRARLGMGPRWWRILPWTTAAAAFSSMSRGPQLAVLMSIGVLALFRLPAWRGHLATAALTVGVVAAVGHDYLLDALHVWSNEADQDKQFIVVNGASVEYSGTKHRLLQLSVYREAAAHAGWFGYGMKNMSAVPPEIPHVEEHLREIFVSIDNHYLWFLLKSGYLGLTLFVLLGICALSNLLLPALATDAPQGVLAAGMFAAILSVLVLVTTVYFAADFGFLWLFNVGFAASLRRSFDSTRLPAIVASPAQRLVPGHPELLAVG
jgi:hypothetical protein